MKEIYLKRASARNFKGFENVSFDFTERESTIVGANGTGKSSLFAMFIWCLFGKDQFGRSDHQIKTLIDGKTDRYKDCEVELTLSINEVDAVLKRVYAENWVRPKGKAEDEFRGNETKRYINDVEVKASEYDAYVRELCPEETFRVITNPHYFPNLRQDEQRAILFKMVGDISDESIAAGNKEFEEFLQMLTGKSFEQFKKEVANQKKRLKDEASSIPARIDELKRTIPEAKNWDSLQALLEKEKAELSSIDSQLGDASKRSEEENAIRLQTRSLINQLEEDNQTIQFKANRAYNQNIAALQDEIQKLHLEEGNRNRDYNSKQARLTYLQGEKTRISGILQSLGEEWKKINAETLVFSDGEFECPTCKRPLEIDDIEAKQAEMTAAFNLKKSEMISKNENEGKSRKTELDAINAEIDKIGELQKADTSDIQAKIEAKKVELEKAKEAKPDITGDAKYIENTGKIARYKLQLETPVTSDTSELIEKKAALIKEIEGIKSELATKDIIENTDKRITELTGLESKLNQEIADLERKEFLQKSFEFAKNESYEKQINEMFSLVKFNLFRTQVDGQVVPTCECHVDGVPYSTQNNAMKLAMSLDIMDTLSRYEGIYAPIFLDNRESVSEIPEVTAQIINLVVDASEKQLRQLL